MLTFFLLNICAELVWIHLWLFIHRFSQALFYADMSVKQFSTSHLHMDTEEHRGQERDFDICYQYQK